MINVEFFFRIMLSGSLLFMIARKDDRLRRRMRSGLSGRAGVRQCDNDDDNDDDDDDDDDSRS